MYATRLNARGANNYIPYQVLVQTCLETRHRILDSNHHDQEFESVELLSKLLSEPTEFRGHLMRYATSIASAIAYGRRMPSADDPGITTLIEVRDVFLSDRLGTH